MKRLFFFSFMLFIFGFGNIKAQTDIATARTMAIGSTVTITGIVTNGSEFGNLLRHIQDNTAGIAAYSSTLSNVNRGDEITLTGKLKDYNGLLEIDPVTSHSINSFGNSVTPKVISMGEIGESLEGQLVQINDVTINATGTFASGQNYDFSSGGNTSVIRVNTGSPLIGMVIPSTPISLVAILSQYSSTYQLLPRDAGDLQTNSSVTITEVLSQLNMSQTGFDLTWSSNVSGNESFIMYGKTQNFELGMLTATSSGTDHTVTINGANPADIFFTQGFTVNGTDTVSTGLQAFATVSASAGNIRVYFNNSVDNSVSNGQNAVTVANMADSIAAFIDRATLTLDVCVYNNDNSIIVNALNDAVNRGVVVRYITEEGTLNSGLSSLSGSINVLKGSPEGLMHNKFIVKDAFATDQDEAWVLTGSTNFTSGNLGTDFNSVIQLQDASLARTYTIEFEEMWGSTTATPNTTTSKFGANKVNNTPHNFLVGGRNIESYFSPSDNVTAAIESAIKSSDSDLEFAVLTFTRNELSAAVKDAFTRGVDVKGMIENTTDMGSDFDYLQNEIGSENILAHTNSGDLHHKYAIIDPNNSTSDPQLVIGSHNWSSSAETINDENTLIIHDTIVPNLYYQEFSKRFKELGGIITSSFEFLRNDSPLYINIFPNPSNSQTTIEFNSIVGAQVTVSLFDLTGKKLYSAQDRSKLKKGAINVDISSIPKGIYLVDVEAAGMNQIGKLIVL